MHSDEWYLYSANITSEGISWSKVSLTAALVCLKISQVEYVGFEGRTTHSIEAQLCCFFGEVITETALHPSVCETGHSSSVSGLILQLQDQAYKEVT